MTGIRFAAAAALTSLLVGCASDYGGRMSGGNDVLSPEERRLQNVEGRVATLSRRLDAANLNGADEQNQRTRQDLTALRGDVEKLRYDVTQLQQRNNDLAQRLQKLETAAQSNPAAQVYGYGTGGAVAAPSYAAPAVTPTTPAVSAPPAAPANLPPTHADSFPPPAAPSVAPSAASLPPAATVTPAPAISAPAPATVPAASTPAAAAPGEEAAYLAAFDALQKGKYDDALRGFRAQLEQWPSGKFADAALYWSGEAFYVKSDYKSAQGAFQGVLQRFPQSVKAPDATLKLGLSQLELKQTADGKATLQRVVRTYPNTSAARLAQQRLDSVK